MNPYLSQLGYQGFNILFVVIIIAFYYYKHITNPLVYLSVLVWQFSSHLLNVIIKNTLRMPRPDSYDKKAHGDNDCENLDNSQYFNKIKNSVTWKNYLIIHRNFGMPSGHAQAVVSEFIFIALYFKKPLLTLVSFAQVALTIYQRYATRRHSIKQLVAGSSIGVLVGVGFYHLFKYNVLRIAQ